MAALFLRVEFDGNFIVRCNQLKIVFDLTQTLH